MSEYIGSPLRPFHGAVGGSTPTFMPRPIPGRLYDTGYAFSITTGTSVSMPNNVLRAVPFGLAHPTSFDRMVINVVTAVAENQGIFGIYAEGDDGLPAELLLETDPLSIATTGQKLAIVDLELEPGLYWLAFVSSLTTSFSHLATAAIRSFGMDGGNINATSPIGISAPHTFGPLPDPFPAGGTLQTANMPRIALRAV